MGCLHWSNARCFRVLVSLPVLLSLFFIYCYSADLRASVRGFPNNSYRCCESVEEGQRALDEYLLKQPGTSVPPPAPDRPERSAKAPTPCPAERPIPDMPTDESWWCCFAGAKPGVYKGLYVPTYLLLLQSTNCYYSDNLAKASPAQGGVRPVDSEEEGWKMWTDFLANGQVQIIPK